jgi:flagella basal body P-ring formation protein FlgA
MRPAITMLCLALVGLLAPRPARADVSDQIRAEIDAALPAQLRAVDLRVPASLASARSGAIAIDWRRPARPGWTTLRVQVGERSGWVRARLAALTATLIAVRDLPAGHTLDAADVRIEQRAAFTANPSIDSIEGAIGRALRRPVAAGAAIPPAALERAAPLPRGHMVTAHIRRGSLSVSAAGVLERAAPIGSATSVRLRATGRVVRGRLVDAQTVVIEVSP